MAAGSLLGGLGFPLIVLSALAGAGSTHDEYSFGWEQKAGVVMGCVAVWLACIVLSGWRPRSPVISEPLDALRAALQSAPGAAVESTWFDVSQTRTVRGLGVVQAVVILTAALCLLVFTSVPWYGALLLAIGLSVGLNLVISRYTRSVLHRERRRRSR